MITNRHRGLVRIHGGAVILCVAVFFWAYAAFIMAYVPVVKLSREVNLLPYFLCVVIGMLAATGRIRAVEPRLTRLSGLDAAGLATTQVALMALAVFSMMFATQDHRISRLFLGSFLLWSWVGLVWLHGTLPGRLAKMLYGQGELIPTLFIGRVESLPQLQEWLAQRAHLGVLPAGFVSLDSSDSQPSVEGPSHTVAKPMARRPEGPRPAVRPSLQFKSGQLSASGLSTLNPQLSTAPLTELPLVLESKSIGQVILMELPENPATARLILDQCQARGCRLLIHHQVDEVLGHPVVSVDEGGRHFFTLHEEPLEEPLNRAVKRAFDLVVALPVVVLFFPLLIPVVWLVQRIQSPGPLFHVRPRSGEKRREFFMLKFRSMYVTPPNEKAEVQQAQSGDPRIYPFGRFLRRHSLDEFPQFWNVLTGEMSIVGPRPVMPMLDEEFERQVRAYRSKHWVKPGITGLAQSEGFRGEITTPEQLQERIRLDLYYIAHWSIGLDVVITLKTLRQVFFPPKSAY